MARKEEQEGKRIKDRMWRIMESGGNGVKKRKIKNVRIERREKRKGKYSGESRWKGAE